MSPQSVPSSNRGAEDPKQPLSPAGCLTQFASGFGGFAVIVLIWVTIVREPPWTYTIKDVLYWAAAIGVVVARHVDRVRYGGLSPTGEPATSRDVRRFGLTLLVVVGLLWCIGQAIHV